MHLHCTPAEAEGIGHFDSMRLLESIYAEKTREAKWDAALHDKKLR